MDFKGITWAGNIYQKFETMCSEVEEVMYEDTVKYVENQVQKVGVSVKKFYSEVMQDLLPPSCVDPVKSSGNLSFSPYADIKKPKVSVSDGERELRKKDNEESSINIYNGVNHRVLVENTGPKLCSTKSKVGLQNRSIGIKRISHNNRPAKVFTPVTSNASNEIASAESQMERKDNSECISSLSDKILSVEHYRAKMDDSEFTSPASENNPLVKSVTQKKEDMECISPAFEEIVYSESHRQIIDNFESYSLAIDVISRESARQKKYDSGCTSSSGSLPSECISMNRNSFSKSVSSLRSNGCEDESIATPNEVVSMKDDSFYQLNSSGSKCNVENADDFDMEVIENDETSNPNLEIFEKSKLEESCVFVEGDEFHPDQGIKKHKSYKKKIKEALSSKLRSPRKQDQLIYSQSKDPGEKNNSGVVGPTRVMDSDKRKKAVHESLESDWELL